MKRTKAEIKNARHKEVATCKSKLSFTTKEAVISHVKNLNKEGVLAYYSCGVCANYHTATLPGKNKVSQKREHTRQKRENSKNRIKKMR